MIPTARNQIRPWLGPISVLIVSGILGCSSAYYGAMEQFGVHKRDILRSRVEDARNDQQAAQEQFLTTYERFKQVSGADGGELEQVYNALQTEFDRSEARAAAVRDRIGSIENVAGDLFREWEAEIEQISSASLRSSSGQQLQQTRVRYDKLISAMRRVEGTMEPVLTAFRDRVLFLKHNLNAQAVSQLDGTSAEIRTEVDSLLRDMKSSIDEADRFLAELGPA